MGTYKRMLIILNKSELPQKVKLLVLEILSNLCFIANSKAAFYLFISSLYISTD